MDVAKDFTYDHVTYAGLPEFVSTLHSVGMHWVPIIDPGISNTETTAYKPYDQGIEMNVFVKESLEEGAAPFVGKVWTSGTLVWPDFTHPNATEYWTAQLQSFHDQVEYVRAFIPTSPFQPTCNFR